MNDAQILARLRDRDRVLVVVLESERDQPPIERFDWAGWRRSREELVEAFRTHGEDRARIERVFAEWPDPPLPQVVDNPVYGS